MNDKNALSSAVTRINDLLRQLRDARHARNQIEEAHGIFRCSVCLEAWVDPSVGEDTCTACRNNL